MKFLANENFPFPSIQLIRQSGFDVDSVLELFPGIPDGEVVIKARETNSIILTFDKDYGEIIYKHGLEYPPAVIFFRFKGTNPEAAGQRLVEILKDRKLEFEKRFTVFENRNIRQRIY